MNLIVTISAVTDDDMKKPIGPAQFSSIVVVPNSPEEKLKSCEVVADIVRSKAMELLSPEQQEE